jgi:hypothetical protein
MPAENAPGRRLGNEFKSHDEDVRFDVAELFDKDELKYLPKGGHLRNDVTRHHLDLLIVNAATRLH